MPFYFERKFKSLIGLLAILLALPVHVIAEPLPPVIECSGEGCPPSANTPGYDLSGFPIHFSINWPGTPLTSRTINVTPNDMSSLRSAVSQNGVRVEVPAGTYNGNLNTWGNNVDLVMSNGATVVGSVDMTNTNNIRWLGGNLVSNNSGEAVMIANASDIVIDNVNMSIDQSSAAGNEGISMRNGVNRFALLNSTIDFTAGNGWAIHSIRGADYNDIFIANSKVLNYSSGAAFRLNPVNRFVVVDSYMYGNSTAMRVSGAQDVFWGNVINIGHIHTNYTNSPTSIFNYDAQNLVADNVSKFGENRMVLFSDTIGWGTIRNSTVYGATGGVSPSVSPMTDGGGNRTLSWNGGAIDFSSMPGKSSDADYGADH